MGNEIKASLSRRADARIERLEPENAAGRVFQRGQVHPVEIGFDALLGRADGREHRRITDRFQTGSAVGVDESTVRFGGQSADPQVGAHALTVHQFRFSQTPSRTVEPAHAVVQAHAHTRLLEQPGQSFA